MTNVPAWLVVILIGGGSSSALTMFGLERAKPELVSSVLESEFVGRAEYDVSMRKIDQELASRHSWMMEQTRQQGKLVQQQEIQSDTIDAMDNRQRSMHSALIEVSTRQGRMEVQLSDTKEALISQTTAIGQAIEAMASSSSGSNQ